MVTVLTICFGFHSFHSTLHDVIRESSESLGNITTAKEHQRLHVISIDLLIGLIQHAHHSLRRSRWSRIRGKCTGAFETASLPLITGHEQQEKHH